MKPDVKSVALALHAKGFGWRVVSRILDVPRQTVSTWFYGRSAGHSAGHSAKGNAGHSAKGNAGHVAGQWMQSLHHESAHFIVNGEACCSANITAGIKWFPHDGCVRKCMRCMKASK